MEHGRVYLCMCYKGGFVTCLASLENKLASMSASMRRSTKKHAHSPLLVPSSFWERDCVDEGHVVEMTKLDAEGSVISASESPEEPHVQRGLVKSLCGIILSDP